MARVSGRRARAEAPQGFSPSKLPTERPGRAGGKRDLNRALRVRRLLEAARGAFVLRGVEAVTVDEITRAAGVAKGSFYRYFDDKLELVQALFAPLGADVLGAFDRCEAALASATAHAEMVAAYDDLTAALASVCLQNPELVLLYLREGRSPEEGDRAPIRALSELVRARAIELTGAAHRHGLLRDLPPRVTAVAVIGAVEALLFEYLEGQHGDDPAALGAALVSMVLEGLRAPRSPSAKLAR